MKTRRDFLKAAGWSAACAITCGCAGAGHSGSLSGSGQGGSGRKPNFVFILVDDMGWPDIGCYGHKFHETPNIDRLASQGMKFTDAYAACPVCSPTRASIYSGQYPARIGITDFITGHWRPWEKLISPINRQQYMPLETVTVVEALKGAGYTSAMFGKWHLGSNAEHYPDKQGFDSSIVRGGGGHFGNKTIPDLKLTKEDYLSEVLTEQSEKFMQANAGKPFCLFLCHYAVHIPLEARQALIEKYENKPKPRSGVNNPIYAAMVEHVDDSVGNIMKSLDELNLSDNTVLVFFSDNGGLRQRFDRTGPIVSTNAPLRDEKGTLYEGGIREPLIVRWPGVVKKASTCSTPVTSVDFYPTFLDIAGAKGDAGHVLDGESIVPLLAGKKALKRDAIFWHYPHYHHSTPAGAIRKGPWKLIEFFDDNRVELYNLQDDIGEKKNLAKKMPKKASQLQKQLAAWRKSVKAKLPTKNPNYDPAKAEEWGTHPDRPVKKRPQPKRG